MALRTKSDVGVIAEKAVGLVLGIGWLATLAAHCAAKRAVERAQETCASLGGMLEQLRGAP